MSSSITAEGEGDRAKACHAECPVSLLLLFKSQLHQFGISPQIFRTDCGHLQVDYLTALAMVVEIGDFRRFETAEQFMAFLGLVPSEHSSGGKRRQGAITKTGNGHLRRLLVESSWHYRSNRPASAKLRKRREGQSEEVVRYADRAMSSLAKKFQRLRFRGKSAQVTVTAVARELAGFIWGLMVGRTEVRQEVA